MRTPLGRLLATLAVMAAGGNLAAQPPEGSKIPPDENACVMCHGEPDLWEEDTLRLYMPAEKLANDIHWQKGVNCHDCHGGDPDELDPGALHSAEAGFRELADVQKACANCHKDQLTALRKSVHARAGERDELDRGTPMVCGSCHGENPHLLYPARDARSPVFADKQVQTCGHCHEEDLNTYMTTVHGIGLFQSGLMVTAVCSSCHGAHGIYYAADVRSTLHPTKVATTCGKCHRFIEERLEKSVHGQGSGPGGLVKRAAPGGNMKRKPSCTDCHQRHHMLRPGSARFEQELSSLCGNCHPDLSSRYSMSLHGELTQLGYEPAAKCADCHGSHDIRAADDPASRLAAGENRLATCRQCHLYAVRNFSDFDPHANYKDEENYPGLHAAYAPPRRRDPRRELSSFGLP